MAWAALLLAALLPAATLAFTTAELRHRSIYQVLTDRFARPDGRLDAYCNPADRLYCGGGWKGIERNLGYIQEMGFDTIWISPVVANIEGIEGPDRSESYHGYWASDIFQLNHHYGSRQDLLDLSNAIHAAGMFLMVDVVANHVGTTEAGRYFEPSDFYGPFVLPEHYHKFCLPMDWDNQVEAEQCWLDDYMADINTEHPDVIFTLQTWIRHLVATFGIDAIRIDTVKHVRKDFWPSFVNAAGVAAVGEVWHGNPAFLRPYQDRSIDSLLDYATFYHLRRAFESTIKPIDELTNMIVRVHRELPDPTLLASFLDNHDTPRFASGVRDRALLKNAAVYPFINDGFPIVYQGQEHGLIGADDPHNREAIWRFGYSKTRPMYTTFQRLNHARRRAMAFPAFLTTLIKWHKLDAHTVAILKLPMVSVLTNIGSAALPRVHYLPGSLTSYQPKMAVVDVLTGQVFATDPQGGLPFTIVAGEPRVFLPLAVFEGRRQMAWQVTEAEQRQLMMAASPRRKTTAPPSIAGSHSRGSSFSSIFSWIRGSK